MRMGASLGRAPVGVRGCVTARQAAPAGWLSWLEHPQRTERLQARFPVEVCTGGNRSVFLSLINVSLSLSFPSSFSKINKHPQLRM